MNMKIIIYLFLIAFCTCLSGMENTENPFDQNFQGNVKISNWYFPRKHKSEAQPKNVFSLFLRGDYNASIGNLNGRLNAYLNFDPKNVDRRRYRIDDAYISWYNDFFETKIGYQQVSWKVVEGISQADLINQIDYELDLFSPMKLSEFCVQGRFFIGSHIIELYYMPSFKQALFPQKGNRYDLFAGKYPETNVNNKDIEFDGYKYFGLIKSKMKFGYLQGALRYRLVLGNYDISLFYFEGYRRFPILVPKLNQDSTIKIGQRYSPITSAGFAFQGNCFNSSIRGEFVFNRFRKNIYSPSGKAVSPYISYTIGIQRIFSISEISSGEIGAFFELIGDSDSKKDVTKLESIRLYQNNVCLGMEFMFNNSTERAIRGMSITDYFSGDIIIQFAYLEKLFNALQCKVYFDGFAIQKSKMFSTLSKSQKIGLDLNYFF